VSDLLAGERELMDSNDIYYRFLYEKAGFECKLIYPATAAHIAKYSEQQRKLIIESPDMHQTITRPFFDALRQAGQVAWIQNILADKSEMERRLFDSKCPESGGFIILPDYKWVDESNVNALYLLVIVRRNDLWSVRDLGANELPLLLAIRQEIKNVFNTSRFCFPDGSSVLYEHLRIFVHYPPTYPHLHIHVVFAGSSSMTAGAAVGQAILLDDIIENIQSVDSEYYRLKRNLTMQFGIDHELYRRLSK
jgi:m7GpppX diphosphatase